MEKYTRNCGWHVTQRANGGRKLLMLHGGNAGLATKLNPRCNLTARKYFSVFLCFNNVQLGEHELGYFCVYIWCVLRHNYCTIILLLWVESHSKSGSVTRLPIHTNSFEWVTLNFWLVLNIYLFILHQLYLENCMCGNFVWTRVFLRPRSCFFPPNIHDATSLNSF